MVANYGRCCGRVKRLRFRAFEIDIVIEMEQRLVTFQNNDPKGKNIIRATSIIVESFDPQINLTTDAIEIRRCGGDFEIVRCRTTDQNGRFWETYVIGQMDVGCYVDALRTALAPFIQSLLQVAQYEGLRYRSQIDTLLYTLLVLEKDNNFNVFRIVGTEHREVLSWDNLWLSSMNSQTPKAMQIALKLGHNLVRRFGKVRMQALQCL